MRELTLSRVARQLELSALRRWARDGVVTPPSGGWTPAAASHGRIDGATEPYPARRWEAS